MSDMGCESFERRERLDAKYTSRLINAQKKLIQEQADLIALLKAQLKAKEEGDLCI